MGLQFIAMKNLLLILLIFITACSRPKDFYSGIVLDKNQIPIENVLIMEDDSTNTTFTDKSGYFKLKRNPTWLGNIIFIKEGYLTDTIPSVWHQAGETTEYNFLNDDTTVVTLKPIKKLAKHNLSTLPPIIQDANIPQKWNGLNEIQKNWIQLEADENGFLIYIPCKGVTPTLKFEHDQLIITNQNGLATAYEYDKFTRLNGNQSFRLTAFSKENHQQFEVSARIINAKKGIVLWTINGDKKYMTPIEKEAHFRRIINSCEGIERMEKEFKQVP